MSLWPLIIVISGITFVALFFSGRKKIVASVKSGEIEKTEAHFKLQLDEIENDLQSGKLNPPEAEAIKAELARELLRHRSDAKLEKKAEPKSWINIALAGTSVVAIGAAFGIYLTIGTPDQTEFVTVSELQQAQNEAQNQTDPDFSRLLLQVEQQMRDDPDDVRGWKVLAPAYIRAARYDDAIVAYRKILELEPPTADVQTDLAEALLVASDGNDTVEALQLLNSAAQLDQAHIRSRFYLAAEATRIQDWDNAVQAWNELLALGDSTAPWFETAKNGLAVALARGETPSQTPPQSPTPQPPILQDEAQAELIGSMVSGLQERLSAEGGTVEEWTRLVRSYLVLGEQEKASQTYANARNAYPDPETRLELDALAAEAGLTNSSE